MKSGEGQSREALVCLIVAHNLGDAVIQSNFLKRLAAHNYARRYLVWTRPQVAFLFEHIADCEVVSSQFPIGTSKQFGGLAFLRFLKAAWKIRQRRPSLTIDLIGDVRDRFFAKLAGSPRHVHMGWAGDHPFTRLIRNPWGNGRPAVTVPPGIPNVYDAHALLLNELAPSAGVRERYAETPRSTPERGRVLRVGLHPFASQACKIWPFDNWRALVDRLLKDNTEITAFGAPSERSELEKVFDPFDTRIKLVTEDIPTFARSISSLDIMVGLDSFSVHMAYRQHVAAVMINAGNPANLWAPPGTQVLAGSGGCPIYPCFNIPQCENTNRRYACVNSVSVSDVYDAIEKARPS